MKRHTVDAAWHRGVPASSRSALYCSWTAHCQRLWAGKWESSSISRWNSVSFDHQPRVNRRRKTTVEICRKSLHTRKEKFCTRFGEVFTAIDGQNVKEKNHKPSMLSKCTYMYKEEHPHTPQLKVFSWRWTYDYTSHSRQIHRKVLKFDLLLFFMQYGTIELHVPSPVHRIGLLQSPDGVFCTANKRYPSWQRNRTSSPYVKLLPTLSPFVGTPGSGHRTSEEKKDQQQFLRHYES